MIKALIFLVLTTITFYSYVLIKKSEKRLFIISNGILLIIVSVLIYFLSFNKDNSKDQIYVPPTYDGERVIPGHFDEKN
tara:strand:- start:221 stop:457 length:237 start_codon:yes stop_codon:yes gene_type:complete